MNTERVRTILVVDDTEIIRDLLVEVLRNDGYTVDEASNGIEAVEKVKQRHYDLVFTDMHMPRQDGLTTARKVNQADPLTMVVVTDSYPDKLSQAIEQPGVVGTICKPFDLAELRSVLLRAEDHARQHKATHQGVTSSPATMPKS